MGISDSAGDMFDKAKEKTAGNADQAKGGVDKGGEKLDEKTRGKHKDKIDKGTGAAKDRIDRMGGNS